MSTPFLVGLFLTVVGLTAVFYAAKAPTGTIILRTVLAAVGFALTLFGLYMIGVAP